jgi:release factor glutamine methyltransferase
VRKVLVKIVNDGWSIKDALQDAIRQLEKAGIEDPAVDAQLLLCNVLEIRKNELYLDYNKIITDQQQQKFQEYINKRINKYPVDYITGYSYFMGLKFKVNENTLIPRPETELLVEKTAECIKEKDNSLVLEMGTGSGNIAVSLAKLYGCRVVTVDKSKDAIVVAKKNAVIHEVDSFIEFIHNDLFVSLKPKDEKRFDCIVSNPPYIKTAEYELLSDEVKKEPVGALVAGEDGLDYIKTILTVGQRYVKRLGCILIEIGYDQKEALEEYLKSTGFGKYEFIKDYAGIDRILYVMLD